MTPWISHLFEWLAGITSSNGFMLILAAVLIIVGTFRLLGPRMRGIAALLTVLIGVYLLLSALDVFG